MKLFVTGTKGQVVTALAKLQGVDGLEVVTFGRPDLDLANANSIRTLLINHAPDVVVNAAAFTAVDKAEEEGREGCELAFAVNGKGAGRIAKAAADLDLPIVQISTDYVFSGEKSEGFHTENDPTAPITIYGKSKLAGENAVIEANSHHVILRTAWIYSETGTNFLKTMLRVGAIYDKLDVVSDQFGAPTHADAIAAGIVKVACNLVEQPDNQALMGIFHMSCTGATSWKEFAEVIFKASDKYGGPVSRVNAITTAEYPLPAPRPKNSRLDCSKILHIHDVAMPAWEEAVERTVQQVIASS